MATGMAKKELDYCVKCKNPMAEIEIGGKLNRCFVCVDKECERFGLMAVVGYKMEKRMGVKNKDGLSDKKIKKSN